MNPPGISITCNAPLWSGYADAWHLTQQIAKYTHTIEALGGYWSAQFTIRGNRHIVDDWLQNGLGRHIEVFDHSLTKIWEGFVDKISANYGPLSVVRGPLLDIANRVLVRYSTIDYDEDGNIIIGTRVRTGTENDTDSQTLWGIVPVTLSTGGVTAGEADAIRDAYIDNHALPRTDKEMRSDSSTDTSITVDCLGYVHWLNFYYEDTAVADDDADDKLIDILGDTPNVAWLAFNTEHVEENLVQVSAFQEEDTKAWSAVKSVAARGGTSYERWLFGIYDDLEAYYHAAPTTLEYQQRLSQPRPIVEHTEGDEVYPWNVRPGKWLIFPDFLIGQSAEVDLRDDQRAMFIETVKYTAPWSLHLKGGSVDTIDALVAQLGLSGIGA